ncbi:MAG: FkbM family methyltransferase [Proteobacteria bacterium]|nr:FkbM family methyltransferase [Pseudomonadota bacterium]
MLHLEAAEILRTPVTLRSPFAGPRLSLLARVHRAAFRDRPRRMAKRLIGKPAKRLYRLLLAVGAGGGGTVLFDGPEGRRRTVTINARNTQFGALYLPQNEPVYEPETSALLDRLVGDTETVFDIGANWGWYALLIASRPGFAGTVHAFEPFPSTFDDLRRTVDQCGLAERIRCHRLALAAASGEADMAFSDGVQSGLARLGETGGVKGTPARVQLARLDDLGLAPPAVIKIDAEDHELAVLEGARATLGRARPLVVFENWLHRGDPRLTLDPIRLLAELNYRFFYPGWVEGDADCIVASRTRSGVLALVPFVVAQRFQLAAQLNILAVPAERLAELRTRFLG